jgi:hypothetical protein
MTNELFHAGAGRANSARSESVRNQSTLEVSARSSERDEQAGAKGDELSAPLGVIMLDHHVTRPPGDPGNPATFPFPILIREVKGVSLDRLLTGDRSILGPLLEAGRNLVESGVWGITTGCGFFVIFQSEMVKGVSVPVFLSSLLQLPLVQATLGPDRSVGILTAHSGRLTQAHLDAAGRLPGGRVTIVGLEEGPHFLEGVLTNGGPYDGQAIRGEVMAAAKRLVGIDPSVGAIVLECTNLPPFAKDIQETTGLPVYDITTLVRMVHSGQFRGGFDITSRASV